VTTIDYIYNHGQRPDTWVLLVSQGFVCRN